MSGECYKFRLSKKQTTNRSICFSCRVSNCNKSSIDYVYSLTFFMTLYFKSFLVYHKYLSRHKQTHLKPRIKYCRTFQIFWCSPTCCQCFCNDELVKWMTFSIYHWNVPNSGIRFPAAPKTENTNGYIPDGLLYS